MSTNIFSAFSLLLNFFLLIKINSKYGISSETDTYFLSIVIVTFISIISQLIWEAITKYYIEFESKNNIKSSYLYSSLLNINILFSLLIICLYFFMNKFTNLIPNYFSEFMDIFIFYVLLQNIYTYNKYILNIKGKYSLFYLLDIFIISFNLLAIYIASYNNILLLAYSTIFGTTIVILYQFILIFYKYRINYYFVFYLKIFKNVYLNSFNLKLGQVFYLSKDILISIYIQNLNINGLYSLYTYAFKLVSLGFQVIQVPIFNKYVVKLSNLLKKKDSFFEIKELILKNIIETFLLILLLQFSIYLFLPEILKLLSENISENQIEITKSIFIFLSFGNLIYIIISFIERYLSFEGLYVKIMKISLLFFIITLMCYFFTTTKIIENIIINIVILPNIIYLLLIVKLYFNLLKKDKK